MKKKRVKAASKNAKQPKGKLKKVLLSYRALPQKKQYLEFFTALLSIPVLITVIILNFNTLNNLKKASPTPTPAPNGRFIIPSIVIQNGDEPIVSAPTQGACKKEIGPVDISTPKEHEVVTQSPVGVIITYDDASYCAVVWAYRINNGNWSNYDNKSVALYNLPSGNIKFDLKVKSIVADKEKTITRNFVYQDSGNSASTSAN